MKIKLNLGSCAFKLTLHWTPSLRQSVGLFAVVLLLFITVWYVKIYSRVVDPQSLERLTREKEELLLLRQLVNQSYNSNPRTRTSTQKELLMSPTPTRTNEILIPSETSSTPTTENPHEYVLVVAVLSKHRLRRDTIRATWKNGNYTEPHYDDVVVKFIVGTLGMNSTELSELEEEEAHYHDIVFLPQLQDTYSNLTRKVLYTIEWVDRHMNYSYFLKCDDDSFVMLDRMAHELHSRKEARKFFWGYFLGYGWPKNDGPWAEDWWYLCDLYLPYAYGGGYVLSQDVVHAIAVNAESIELYAAEDVTMGVWTASFDLERKHDSRFDVEEVSRGCKNDFLITHKQSVEDIHHKHNLLHSRGVMCEEETLWKVYRYNWKKRPSKCCKYLKIKKY